MAKKQSAIYTSFLNNQLSFKSWAILTQSLNIAQKSLNNKAKEGNLYNFITKDNLSILHEIQKNITDDNLPMAYKKILNDLRNYFSHSYHSSEKLEAVFNNDQAYIFVQKMQNLALYRYEQKFALNNQYNVTDRSDYFNDFIFTHNQHKTLTPFTQTTPIQSAHIHFILHYIAPLLSHQQIGLAVSKLMYNLVKDTETREDVRQKYIKYYQCLSHRGIYYAITDDNQKLHYKAYEIIAHLASFRVFKHNNESEIAPIQLYRNRYNRFVWGSRYIIEYLLSLNDNLEFKAIDYQNDKQKIYTRSLVYSDDKKQNWYLENNSTAWFKYDGKEYSISISQLYFWVLSCFYFDEPKKEMNTILNYIKGTALNEPRPLKSPVSAEQYYNEFFMRQSTGKLVDDGIAYHNFWNRWSGLPKTPHDHMLYVMKSIGYFVKFYHFEQSKDKKLQQEHCEFGLNKEEHHQLQAMIDTSYDFEDLKSRLKEYYHLSDNFNKKIEFLLQKTSIRKLSNLDIPLIFQANHWQGNHISWEALAKKLDIFWQELFSQTDDIDNQKAQNLAKLMGWKGKQKKQSKKTDNIYIPRAYIKQYIINKVNKNLPTDEKVNALSLVNKISSKYVEFADNNILDFEQYRNKSYSSHQKHKAASNYIEDITLLLLAINYLKLPKQPKANMIDALLDIHQKTAIDIGDGYSYMVSPRSNNRRINGISSHTAMLNIAKIMNKKELEYNDFFEAVSQLSSKSIMKIAALLKLEADCYTKSTHKTDYFNETHTPSFNKACANIFPNISTDELNAITALRNSLFHFDLEHNNLNKFPDAAHAWNEIYKEIKTQEDNKRKSHRKWAK